MKKTIRFFVFCVVSSAMMFNLVVHAQLGLTNGLVSYYPFSGNANDAFGANNGTNHGAILTTNRFGVKNSAYSFNGSSSYIDFGAPSNLQFKSNYTLTAWCLFSGGSLENPRIISYTWGNGYELQTVGAAATRQFQFTSGAYNVNTTLSYTQQLWYAIALVVTNGTGYFYVNGIPAGSGAIPPPIAFTNNLHIGNNSGNGTDDWGGIIDDVRFYNRSLSTNEVQALYQYESGAPQITSATVALKLSTTNLVVGGSYQIQTSSNLVSWLNYGAPFIATSTNAPQFVSVTSSQGFFRILAAP